MVHVARGTVGVWAPIAPIAILASKQLHRKCPRAIYSQVISERVPERAHQKPAAIHACPLIIQLLAELVLVFVAWLAAPFAPKPAAQPPPAT